MAMVCGNERTQGTHYRHLLPLLFHLLFVVIYIIFVDLGIIEGYQDHQTAFCSPKGQWATKMIPLSIQGRTSTLEMSSAAHTIPSMYCILFVCGWPKSPTFWQCYKLDAIAMELVVVH